MTKAELDRDGENLVPKVSSQISAGVLATAARTYFYSGWAFLIPYLAVYLLYYVTKWPVNPDGQGAGSQETGVSVANAAHAWVPCLLHVYWFLHAVHAICAGFAAWSWWASYRSNYQGAVHDSAVGPQLACAPLNVDPAPIPVRTQGAPLRQAPHSDLPVPVSPLQSFLHRLSAPFSVFRTNRDSPPPKSDPGSVPSFSELRELRGKNVGSTSTASGPASNSSLLTPGSSLLVRLAPWILLALIFYIPGVYLEWPSDPWEHLRRINEWRVLDTVGAHSCWYKTSYFIPYSFLSWCIGLRQLYWLDYYYTGICLLLCWQYYRLSRACGLGERASMVFVIIQALLFGNNIFSFYRYYGISSSIYAQIGAIALTRVVLEWASFGQTNLNHGGTENTEGTRQAFWHLPSLSWLLTAAFWLLLITAFNHVQGIGIAGLGVAAVVVWRLIEWRRSMAWWVATLALVLSAATIYWWPRNSLINSAFRSSGWLNIWYGFDLFSLKRQSDGAAERMMQILGLFGLLNVTFGIILLWRNHILGWLTVAPIIALSLPCVAIPFANSIAPNIIVYHRIFFAIPSGSAIVTLARGAYKSKSQEIGECDSEFSSLLPLIRRLWSQSNAAFLFSLAAAITIPVTRIGFNRTWNVLGQTPKDLAMGSIWRRTTACRLSFDKQPKILIVSLSSSGFIIDLQHVVPHTECGRHYLNSKRSPSDDLVDATNNLTRKDKQAVISALVLDPTDFVTSYSLASFASKHWLPQEAVLVTAGNVELVTLGLPSEAKLLK